MPQGDHNSVDTALDSNTQLNTTLLFCPKQRKEKIPGKKANINQQRKLKHTAVKIQMYFTSDYVHVTLIKDQSYII